MGLIGETDEDRTCEGTIVCKDGFTATTIIGQQFVELFDQCGLNASIVRVDESSVFACARKISTRQREIRVTDHDRSATKPLRDQE